MTAVRERIPVVGPPVRTVAIVVVNAVLALLLLRGTTLGLALLLVGMVALPAVALGTIALLQRPQRGVLLLAALLPLDGLRAVIPFPAGWKEALVLVTLAATFVAPPDARGSEGRRLPSWTLAVAALVALGVVSAVVVGGTQGLVGLKVGFFYVLIAIAVWRCPLDARERDRLVSILIAMGLLTAVVGIAQQVVGDQRLADLGWEYNENIRFAGGYLRSFSTFNQNFPFALFLMLVVLVGLPCALEEPKRRRSQVFFLGLPVLAVALLATVTRGAWLGLAVGLAYLGFTRYRAVGAALLHGLLIATAALLLVGSYSSAFLSQSSSEERFDVWRQNLSDIAEHPLGVGIGETGGAATKVIEITGDDDSEAFEPDNQYFKFAFELGVLGVWLFVLLLIGTFSATHATARGSPGLEGAFASGVAASIVAAAAVSVVASYFEIFPMDAYFWLLLGVVAACSSESH
jgi:hypothetical protein